MICATHHSLPAGNVNPVAVLGVIFRDEMIAEYVAARKEDGDIRSVREIAEEYNDTVIWPDKVRLNKYYYYHYSFAMDIKMIMCTVLGRRMKYGEETI